MSDNRGVAVPLYFDTSAITKSVAPAIRVADELGNAVSKSLGKFGGALAAATGVYAIAKAFNTTTSAALDFNRALTNTWTLLDTSRSGLTKLGGQVRGLAREFNVTSTQAERAMYQINSAVFYGADAMNILKESAKGAAAGLSDVFQVSDMMTTVLNAYGMAASNASKINDYLFTTIKYGKTTLGELAGDFGRLAGVAAPAGAAIQEMTAAIATLTRQGIATDWAVTSLRQTLMQLLRPGSDLAKVIQALGYASGRSMIEANGFANTIKMIADYADRNGILMEQLFSNVRAVTAVLPLATTSAGAFAQDLQRMADSAGAANVAFEKAASSWQYQLDVIKTAIQDTAISFGKLLIPALKGFLQTIRIILTPLAHFSEALGKIGGGYAISIVAGLATITAAFVALRKAIVAVNAALLTGSLSSIGVKIARGLGGATGALTAGALWKGLGLTGLGLLGTGAAIQGVIDLNLALKTSGEEQVKAALKGSLESALGAALGGAIFGKLLGIGAGTGSLIGLGLAGAAVLTIYVVHEIRKSAEEYKATKQQALDIINNNLASANLPSYVSGGVNTVRAALKPYAEQLASLDEEFSKGENAVSVMTDAILDFYDAVKKRDVLQNLGTVGYQKIWTPQQSFAEQFGANITPDMLDSFYAMWKEALAQAQYGDFRGIPSELARYVSDNVKSGFDILNQLLPETLDKNYFSGFAKWFQGEFDKIGQGIDKNLLKQGVSKFTNAMQQLQSASTTADAEKAVSTLKDSFKSLTDNLPDDQKVIAAAQALKQVPAQFVDALLYAFGLSADQFWQAIQEQFNKTSDTPEAIHNITDEMGKAKENFYNLWDELKTGNVTTDQATALWKQLTDAADKWSNMADIAKAAGWESADSIRGLADEMDALVGAAQNASSAVEALSTALANTAIGAGTAGQINTIMNGLANMLSGNLSIGEASKVLSALQSNQGMIETVRTGLERVFAPDSDYNQAQKAAARQLWDLIGNNFPKLGSTIGELTQQAQDLADQQKRQADEAARNAAQAAEEAYKADQEAFKNQFIRPVLDAVATGDFGGAMRQIDALRDNFASLVNKGAKLDMSATDVLGMLTSARQNLLSTIDGLIQINNQYPEIVKALQEAKSEISKAWAEPKSELETWLDQFDVENVVKAPLDIAAKFRSKAAEGEAQAVISYAEQLSQSLQSEIDARQKLGYSTVALEGALADFQSGLTGVKSGLSTFMDAIASYTSGIKELLNTLFPGAGDVFGKLLNFFNAIASSSGGSSINIPEFAEGAIVNGPTIALIGERGPEAVVPLNGMAGFANFTQGDVSQGLQVQDTFATQQTSGQFQSLISSQGMSFAQLDTKMDQFSQSVASIAGKIVSAGGQLASAISSVAITLGQVTFAGLNNEELSKQVLTLQQTIGGLQERQPEQTIATTMATVQPDVLQEFHSIAASIKQLVQQEATNRTTGPTSVEIPQPQVSGSDIAGFVAPVVEQAVARALDAANITPKKAPEPVSGALSPFTEALGKYGPIFNAGASLVTSLFKMARDAMDKAMSKLKDEMDELAGQIKSKLSTIISSLSEKLASLESNIKSLITSTETYSKLQSSLAAIQKRVFDVLMGWALPLIGVFDQLTGAVEDTIDQFHSLNVPTGYKVTRAEWKAATPGEPGISKGSSGTGLPSWVSNLIDQFGDAIKGVTDKFKEFFDMMTGFWSELGPTIMQGILPALGTFGDGLLAVGEKIGSELLPVLKENLSSAIQGFLDFFFGGLLGALNFFTDGLTLTMPHIADFSSALGDIGKKLPKLGSQIAEGLSPAINTALDGLTELAGWIRDTLIPDIGKLSEGFRKLWRDEIDPFLQKEVFPKIGEWGGELYAVLRDKIVPFLKDKVWPWIRDEFWPAFKPIGDALVDLFKEIWSTIEENWPIIKNWIINGLEDWVGGLKTKVGKAIDVVKFNLETGSGNWWDGITTLSQSESLTFWEKLGLTWTNKSGTFWDKFAATFKLSWDSFWGGLGKWWDNLWNGNGSMEDVIDTVGGGGKSGSGSSGNGGGGESNTTPGSGTTPSAAWSSSYYGGLGGTVGQVLSGLGVSSSTSSAIASAWKSTGLSEMDFALMLPYISNKAKLKQVLASGHPGSLLNVGGLPTWNGFSVPGLRRGGFTLSEGLAYLHKHEFVVPAAKTVSLDHTGVGDRPLIVQLVVGQEQLAEVMVKAGRDQLTRSTGSSMGRAWR